MGWASHVGVNETQPCLGSRTYGGSAQDTKSMVLLIYQIYQSFFNVFISQQISKTFNHDFSDK
jgi:hypothetical protein